MLAGCLGVECHEGVVVVLEEKAGLRDGINEQEGGWKADEVIVAEVLWVNMYVRRERIVSVEARQEGRR